MAGLRAVLVALAALFQGALLFGLGMAFFFAQRADYGWSPKIAQPTFPAEHPRVLFDEGHNNASKAGFTGRYWPFARLLRADGYDVQRGRSPFSAATLADVRILVIANASGAPKPQFFGINLPISTKKRRSDPAFTSAQVEAVRAWVEGGGSLFLIADHAPFGQAAAAMAEALGVTMHQGLVDVPGEDPDPLLFTAENGRLGDHAILRGDGAASAIDTVMTYTGQSLDGPAGSTILLRLPENAVEAVPAGGDSLAERPAGPAQGLAFELGRGRVVVLGEGGMVTAQVSKRERYGINVDNDNAQFVRNVMSWLARRL